MSAYTQQEIVSKFNIPHSTLENLPELSYFEFFVSKSSEILIVRKETGGLIEGKTFLNDDHYYWAPWQSAKFTDGFTLFQ